jgi:sporadic carbohydrate cluster protein (TIGR04323 family)
MRGTRGYIFSRAFLGERAPQHVQNIVLRDYCQKNELRYLLSATEYAMDNCYLILEQVLEELPQIDGIVAYSMFQFPADHLHRVQIYERVLREGKKLHFAVEGLRVDCSADIERVENIWRVRQALPQCFQFRETSWEV